MKIGIIQTGGIGDIIQGLPIAMYFCRQGHEVFWPIEKNYVPMFQAVVGSWPIRFHEVSASIPDDYYYYQPLQILQSQNCAKIHCLYSSVGNEHIYHKVINKGFAHSLTFDAYKYAVAGVPFAEKWNLQITRSSEREKALHSSLGIHKRYICIHSIGSNNNQPGVTGKANVSIRADWRKEFQVVHVEQKTDSVFDWIYTLENAAKLILIDSCFANLVEQLNLPNEKYFLFRSSVAFTPILKNNWHYVVVGQNLQTVENGYCRQIVRAN